MMDAFSYLSVLLAIIIGLGMTQVLTAAGQLILVGGARTSGRERSCRRRLAGAVVAAVSVAVYIATLFATLR